MNTPNPSIMVFFILFLREVIEKAVLGGDKAIQESKLNTKTKDIVVH